MTSTAPVKSQALHNFALSPLKWKNNHPRGRSSAATATTTTTSSASPHRQSRSESPLRKSPMKEGCRRSVDCNNRHDRDVFAEKSERKSMALGFDQGGNVSFDSKEKSDGKSKAIGLDHNAKGSFDCKEKSDRKSKVIGLDNSANVSFDSKDNDSKESRSKILVRIPGVMQKNEGDKGVEEVELGANERKGNEVLQGGVDDDLMGRTWNLRPRKPIKISSSWKGGEGGVGSKVGGSGSSVQGRTDALQKVILENGRRIKVGSDVNVKKEKEKKVKFSISLTREEIEEDVFSLTGSKPTRRPKKRAKIVQKNLDNLFPGMWLGSITVDSYKVSDNYMKA